MSPDTMVARTRVVVHVGGSIAAFKACEVVGLLRARGLEVRVAMTAAAERFVTAMTFQALCGHEVATSVWQHPTADVGGDSDSDQAEHGMAHIGLGAWAELNLVVPASADLIARLALGLADDAVTATVLASSAPLVVVPAMETRMWKHPATRANVETLRARGAQILGPVSGRLASGRSGAGRMLEPAAIVAAVERMVADAAAATASVAWLRGRRVVVTSGGTREPIDPVRFVGNRSSGKMGAALAAAARALGAEVTLVTTVATSSADAGVEVVGVETAAEMQAAVLARIEGAALLLMAAAVADYRPAAPAPRKLKKSESTLGLELIRTVDVLEALRDDPRRSGVVVVGFAAETDDLADNALAKLERKGLDAIVANDVGTAGVGMGSDDNAALVLLRGGIRVEVARARKTVVAERILEAVRPLLAG